MRLVVGCSLIANGITRLRIGQPLELTILDILTVADGLLFLAGLWTPVAGFLAVILALWDIVFRHAYICPTILSSMIGVGLSLVGPGAWSLDAWLFGWKKIDLDG
jgi:putative oxidoreductase